MFFDATQNAFLHQHVAVRHDAEKAVFHGGLTYFSPTKRYFVEDLQVCQPLGRSDHVMLTWICIYKQIPPATGAQAIESRRFNFKKEGYQYVKQKLSEIKCEILEDLNVQEDWNYKKESKHIIKLFVPTYGRKKVGGMKAS